MRFFLNRDTGNHLASGAFQHGINGIDGRNIEITMREDDLYKFVKLLALLNDSGGYRVCEICQLTKSW